MFIVIQVYLEVPEGQGKGEWTCLPISNILHND